tara:strand:- start:15572 stop:16861 length:1290 start_codon:yes stop_codon:yes gene_type:complete
MNFKRNIIGIAVAGLISLNTFAAEEKEYTSKVPLDKISKIAEIFSLVDENYVEAPDKEDMLIHAIKGMVSSLDPYSAYLEKNDFQAIQDDVSGETVGLGVVLRKHEKGLEIETVVRGGSAFKNTDLESGDIIVKVKDNYIIEEYAHPFKAIDDIKGKEGTKVEISVYKKRSGEVKKYEIVRTKFTASNVYSLKVDHYYGYVTFPSFQENTAKDLKNEIKKLKKENIKGLILDLRSNPGGLLDSAIEISDMFLDKGVIVSTKSRDGHIEEDEATYGDIVKDLPMVVLIDSGTASAAEIVSGALQDHSRALIVGQTSYGKGSVQTIFPLNGSDGDGLKLTIARYYTPSGRSIQAEGIVPDIKLDRLEKVVVSEYKGNREKDNKGHISNDTDYTSNDEGFDGKNDIESSIEKDYALFMAVNTLKTLHFDKKD